MTLEQFEVFLAGNRIATRTLGEKKHKQCGVFIAIFYVYSHVDNRERARA